MDTPIPKRITIFSNEMFFLADHSKDIFERAIHPNFPEGRLLSVYNWPSPSEQKPVEFGQQ